MANKLKCCTLNVRGLNNNNKRRKIFSFLDKNQFDIVFLQETYCTSKAESVFNKNWDGKCFHSISDSSHSRGTMILFNKSLNIKVMNKHCDIYGRKLLLNVEIDKNVYTLVSAYAPNNEQLRSDFFKKLKNWIPQFAADMNRIIIGMDANCCRLDNDRSNNNHTSDKSRIYMNKLLQGLNLSDVWSEKEPNCNRFTWNDSKHTIFSRLDYLLISNSLIDNCTYISNKFAVCTDHKCVIMQISVFNNKRGKGYWKLNCKLLDNDGFIKEIIDIIKQTNIEFGKILSKRMLWEILKIKIKEKSIKISVRNAKQKKEKIQKIENELAKLENCPDFSHVYVKKEALKLEIDKYYQDCADGSRVRSRVQWIEEGEKSSKYFFDLERHRQSSNVISKLKDNNGKIKEEDTDIMNELSSYYQDLYEKRPVDIKKIHNYLNDIDVNHLTDEDKCYCDQEITEKELHDAITCLKSNKSPGADGLTSEFYKRFWNVIKDPFRDMVKETYLYGELPDSACKAILTLIFKKGDRMILKNYRPISLTNYDYKIIATVLAKRLQRVIHKLISEDQTAYIKGRFIGNNARLICDILDFSDTRNIPGALICLDFEKAFDSVNWDFIFCTLEKFNFGMYFRNWIKILYTNPVINVKNNGWLSCNIPVSRGIRQGCPISALLFILVTEILAIKVKNDNDIHGFKFCDHFSEIKLTQYADDTTLLLSEVESIQHALQCIEEFSEYAGTKLNMAKCKGIWLGPLKNSANEYCNITFTNDAVKCLGVYVGHNKEECYNKNFIDKCNSLEKILNVWKKRYLTMYGRVLIIKTLGISKLTYIFSILHVPEEIIKIVDKICYHFLWNNKERIKRRTLIRKSIDGGIGMIDIECFIKSLKAAWIPRLLTIKIFTIPLRTFLYNTGFSTLNLFQTNCCDIKKSCFIKTLSLFYQDVIIAFNSCKPKMNEYMSCTEFMKGVIWDNKYVLFHNKSVWFKELTLSGLMYIKDLFGKAGDFININKYIEISNDRRNCFSHYSILKRSIMESVKRYSIDTKIAVYVNVSDEIYISYKGKDYKVKDLKSKFFYCCLIGKKSVIPNVQKKWEQFFSTAQLDWNDIYLNKYFLPENKLSEFNYKLINKILPCGDYVSKWDNSVRKFCSFCENNSIETLEHLLYGCPRIQYIWLKIMSICDIRINFKIIVTGLGYNNTNLEYFITIITFAIYKRWITCAKQKLNYRDVNLKNSIKTELLFRESIWKNKRNKTSLLNYIHKTLNALDVYC
jgi:exonuclease III